MINWNRKPRGQTIVARVAREYQMKKAGIETRTPEQIQEAGGLFTGRTAVNETQTPHQGQRHGQVQASARPSE